MDERSLAELAPEERPRERLLTLGAAALDDASLLALVLGTGRGSGEDALQLARRILRTVGGVGALAAAAPMDLTAIDGIGAIRAARIRATFELGRRGAGGGAAQDSGPPAAAPPPPAPPVDPFEAAVERLRGQVPTGEAAVLGYRPADARPPVTLGLGDQLGSETRAGAYLARLLTEGAGPWWIVSVRPGGKPAARERGAADRLLEAAALVGVDIERVVVVGGRRGWILAGAGA
ncbi:MAG: hypothetical protein H6704_16510 [Myxococcales bacterium]|nr:hypothetical protein [Myxococcales bacterium]